MATTLKVEITLRSDKWASVEAMRAIKALHRAGCNDAALPGLAMLVSNMSASLDDDDVTIDVALTEEEPTP